MVLCTSVDFALFWVTAVSLHDKKKIAERSSVILYYRLSNELMMTDITTITLRKTSTGWFMLVQYYWYKASRIVYMYLDNIVNGCWLRNPPSASHSLSNQDSTGKKTQFTFTLQNNTFHSIKYHFLAVSLRVDEKNLKPDCCGPGIFRREVRNSFLKLVHV